MMSSTGDRFCALYVGSAVTADEIEGFVEVWHDGPDTGISLAAHLGMTDAEYARWVADARALPLLEAARRDGQDSPARPIARRMGGARAGGASRRVSP